MKILQKTNTEIILNILLIIAVFIGIFLRIKIYLYNHSFWIDEARLGINIETITYRGCFRPLELAQSAPPFFLIISKFLIQFTNGENLYVKDLILRFFPFLCSLLTIPLFLILTEKIFKNKYLTLLGTSIISINPFLITYAAQFKQYSTDVLFCILLLIIFHTIDLKKSSFFKIFICSTLIAISPWFSFSSIYIIFPGYVYLLIYLIKSKFYNLKKFILIIIPTIISFGLFYKYFYIPTKKVWGEYMYNFWTPYFFTFENFIDLFSETHFWSFRLPFENTNLLIFLYLINIVILLYTKSLKKIILILFPILIIIFSCFMKLYPFEVKFILFLIPIIILLLFQSTLFIQRNKKNDIIIFLISLSILLKYSLFPTSFYIIYKDYTRDFVPILRSVNPQLENIVIIGSDSLSYYIKELRFKYKIENINDIYNENELKNKLDRINDEKSNYIIYTQLSNNQNIKTQEYIKRNYKNIKIWNINSDENYYLLKFSERK